MKKKVIYLHGFNSSHQSETIKKLKKDYGHNYEFVCPQLNAKPQECIDLINKLIKEEKPSLIIGNSLGGFYGLMCESENVPLIVINPCVEPYKQLQRHLQEGTITTAEIENFKTYDSDKIKECIKSKLGSIWGILSSVDEILGDSHIKMFNEVKEESGYPYNFYRTYDCFGHRIYPEGIDILNNTFYETLFDN